MNITVLTQMYNPESFETACNAYYKEFTVSL